ncbi:MAG TPA: DinB family protein [Edaphobacter sp.]|jgi:hypothetical protein|nr:DinB family protein [Edaphobacter sp.]
MKSLASVEVMSEIRARLRTVRVDDRACWGKMTAKQMMRHLNCSYEMALGERVVEPVPGPPPVVIKWLALRSGLRWKRNFQTVPELKQAIAQHADDRFDELVSVAIERTEELAKGPSCAPTHPMFGPMTVEDWMRWGYLHADHHLRQFGR